MADDAKQLQEDFKELERLASKLGKSVNFSNLKNDAEAVKEHGKKKLMKLIVNLVI
jgi:hypothetical protein